MTWASCHKSCSRTASLSSRLRTIPSRRRQPAGAPQQLTCEKPLSSSPVPAARSATHWYRGLAEQASVITLDVNPLDATLAPLVAPRVHRVDHRHWPARSHPRRVRGRLRVPPRRAAVDARRVHAGDGASRQRRAARSTCSSSRRRKGSRTDARSPSSTRRRSRRTAYPTCEAKSRAGRVTEDQFAHPTTMYGCNKLYCEELGRYYARHYKQLSVDLAPRVDFRCVRFPGLISATTLPSGGTSDYAPEMIHAAARRASRMRCFVRPDTTIPFMAMPDAATALRLLAAAPRERLTRTAYNVGAFSRSAAEIREVVLAAFPERARSRIKSIRSDRASSIPGRPTWTTRRRGPIGASPPTTTSIARSANISFRPSATTTAHDLRYCVRSRDGVERRLRFRRPRLRPRRTRRPK